MSAYFLIENNKNMTIQVFTNLLNTLEMPILTTEVNIIYVRVYTYKYYIIYQTMYSDRCTILLYLCL